MNQIIVIPQKLSNSRAKKLYEEFKYAWIKTSSQEKKDWALDVVVIFGKVMLRRGKGFFKAIGDLGRRIIKEGKDFTVAIYNQEGKEHIINRKDSALKSIKSGANNSRIVVKNIISIIKNNPKEAAPTIFLGFIGFLCGSGGVDSDGGISELDIASGGLGNHRSIFIHSIISAAVLETIVFSSVKAIKIMYSKLPEEHDSFWDAVIKKTDWAESFVTGACTGIAYNLLINDSAQTNKDYIDLPFKIPIEGHNTIFVTNAAMKAINLNKNKLKTNK